MPKISVDMKVSVTLDLDEDDAKRVTRDDVIEMAQSAIGNANGVQLIVDTVAQETSYENNSPPIPDFVDCWHECDWDDAEIMDIDYGFDRIET